MKLPESHEQFTDKYFLRTNEILKKENLNPIVTYKVFARGTGKVAGINEAIEVLDNYSNISETGNLWVTKKDIFENTEPLMIIKGPAQELVELETMYLGVLSNAISEKNGAPKPNSEQIKEKVQRLTEIYEDIPITYFGARHYHWSLDQQIAKAALEGGAVQTSTDIGSSNIGLEGVGTTPHALTLILANYVGKENATLESAKLFDKHMQIEIPRVTLVDTFNRELTDSLSVAQYFGEIKNAFRIDTCGENIGEDGSLYNNGKNRDPNYETGTGVTLELARNLRSNLILNGFGNTTETFLSSGFGDEEKAKIFVDANKEFEQKTGYKLFAGVGIGEVSKAKFCTSDIFEVDGKPMYKTGRPVQDIKYETMQKIF